MKLLMWLKLKLPKILDHLMENQIRFVYCENSFKLLLIMYLFPQNLK